MAIALVAAALDERFMFHEWLQDWLRYGVWDDAPWAARATSAVTLVYAVGGLVLLACLKLVARPQSFRWIVAAVAVGCVAIALDIAFNDLGWQVIEELLEAVAESLMLCGLFTETRLVANTAR